MYLAARRVLHHQPQELEVRLGGLVALLHGLLEARPSLGGGSLLKAERLADRGPVDLKLLSVHSWSQVERMSYLRRSTLGEDEVQKLNVLFGSRHGGR